MKNELTEAHEIIMSIETPKHHTVSESVVERIVIPFSTLALGGRFKYTAENENTYVKISNDITGGCIADWDDSKISDNWVGQGIYCLNDDGDDPDIYVVV